ncbi:MAG TPA: TetR/AcrR family transcriptional regulator [Spirochaetota bacterium]|nr:TetR/AcrR family transcriptional regulator [Spirochaetota bacterium]
MKAEERILKHSEELFLNYGYSTITMSRIASELGIGKATIYKYFPTKEAILEKVIESLFDDTNQTIDEITLNPEYSFKEKFRNYLFLFAEKYFLLQNKQTQDIKKNAPDIWKKIENLEREIFYKKFQILICDGIVDNHIKSDFEVELLVNMILNSLQKILNGEIKNRLSLSYKELVDNIIKIYFEGILN